MEKTVFIFDDDADVRETLQAILAAGGYKPGTGCLQLAATGSTNREIGEMLGISYRTVEDHRFNIMHKLGVKNIAELLLTVLK